MWSCCNADATCEHSHRDAFGADPTRFQPERHCRGHPWPCRPLVAIHPDPHSVCKTRRGGDFGDYLWLGPHTWPREGGVLDETVGVLTLRGEISSVAPRQPFEVGGGRNVWRSRRRRRSKICHLSRKRTGTAFLAVATLTAMGLWRRRTRMRRRALDRPRRLGGAWRQQRHNKI